MCQTKSKTYQFSQAGRQQFCFGQLGCFQLENLLKLLIATNSPKLVAACQLQISVLQLVPPVGKVVSQFSGSRMMQIEPE